MLSERFVVTQLVSPNVVSLEFLLLRIMPPKGCTDFSTHHRSNRSRYSNSPFGAHSPSPHFVLPGIGDILFILELGIKNKFAPDFGIQPDVKTVSGGFRRIFPVAHLAQHIVERSL